MLVFCTQTVNIALETSAVSRDTPIDTSLGAPQRRALLPHNVRRQGMLGAWTATWDTQENMGI